MEHKDIWLVLGLTVILAIAVSISTVSLTGDAIFGKVTKASTPAVATSTSSGGTTPWRFSCVFISESDGTQLIGKTAANLCSSLSSKMVPISLEKRYTYVYYSNKYCTGKVLYEDRDTASMNVAGTRGDNMLSEENVKCAADIGGNYKVSSKPSGILCCEVLSNN